MRIHIKLAVVLLLVIVMTIPLLLIVSKIYERDGYAEQARWDISRSWTGEQQVLGPVLVIPFSETHEKREFDKELERYVTNTYETDEQLFILPESLNGDIVLSTEVRYRGIYEVPVYSSSIVLDGTISKSSLTELRNRSDVANIGQPYLSIVVSDMRGIAEPPALDLDAVKVAFLPGSNLAFHPNGIHAPLNDLASASDDSAAFSIALELRGMSSFRFSPVGGSNFTRIRSSWPHPGFDGQYLPTQREISSEGFKASWQTSEFATNINEKADNCALGDCAAFLASSFGVQLVDPVDVYLQSQRASKYGILFVGLTFTAFFLFEVLKRLAIHPIEYTLVGLALTVFYLLLVSLAEHIAFSSAYAIATIACTGLLCFYVTYVLKSLKRGCAFAGAISVLYCVLYIIIQQEDYAFSMGAGLVFVALAGVMYMTRNVDWFRIGGKPADEGQKAD